MSKEKKNLIEFNFLIAEIGGRHLKYFIVFMLFIWSTPIYSRYISKVEIYRATESFSLELINPSTPWVITEQQKKDFSPITGFTLTFRQPDKRAIFHQARFEFGFFAESSPNKYAEGFTFTQVERDSRNENLFLVTLDERSISIKEGQYITFVSNAKVELGENFFNRFLKVALDRDSRLESIPHEEFSKLEPGVLLLGEFIKFPRPADNNSISDLQRYENEFRETVLQRIQEIYQCSTDINDLLFKIDHYNQVVFGDVDKVEGNLRNLNVIEQIPRVQQLNLRYSNLLQNTVDLYQSPRRFQREDLVKKIEEFERSVGKLIENSATLSEEELKITFILDRHIRFIGEYAGQYIDNIEQGSCANPPVDLKYLLPKLRMRRSMEYESAKGIYDAVWKARQDRLVAISRVVEGLRADLHRAYAVSQGEDLSRLSLAMGQNLELFRIGGEVYRWFDLMSLTGYTHSMESLYLQYTESLNILDQHQKKANEFELAIKSLNQASLTLQKKYLGDIEPRKSMLRHLEDGIRSKGWRGFLDEQIWSASDMKDFLHYYPKECDLLIDQFLAQARHTNSYEIFQKTEVLYFNLVKSCDEKAK